MSEKQTTLPIFEGSIKSLQLGKGIFDIKASSPLPPKDNFQIVNTEDYRQAFILNPIICWGQNNKFPTELDLAARQVPVLESGLSILSDILKGQGLFLYTDEYDKETGERIMKEVEDKELSDMLYNTNFYEYYDTACDEFPRWGNVFPIIKLATDGKSLSQIRIYDAPWCRLERHDPDAAKIKNIYVSSQWWRGLFTLLSDGQIPDSLKNWVFKIPLLNDFDPSVQMEAAAKLGDATFAMHIKNHTSGHDYGRAPWHACFEAGWLGISKGVPKMLKKLFESLTTINYHIEVDAEFWKLRYGQEWDNPQIWTKSKKAEEVAKWQKEMERNIVGPDNTGKSIFTTLIRVGNNTEQISAIKITVIDNKLLAIGEKVIPNSQQADGQILNSIGLDPSMVGVIVPGGKQSAGSGSNIREATLALQGRMRPMREKLLLPFYVMRDYAYPDKKHIKIGVRDYMINTLDARALTSGKEVTPKA